MMPVPSTHDRFRGKEGSWGKTVAAIKEASKRGFKVRVAMCVTVENLFHIDETLSLAKSLGAKLFSWSPVFPIGRGNTEAKRLEEEKLKVGKEKIAAYELSILEKHKDFLHTVDEEFVKYMLQKRANCGMGTRTWVIDPRGNTRPCVMMPENFMYLGNIFQDGIEQIANHPILNALGKVRAPTYNDLICKECKNKLICSMCFFRAINAVQETGSCEWVKDEPIQNVLKYCDFSALTDSKQCRATIFD